MVNFPTSLDSLTNPSASDNLNSPSHSAQHANANDILEAIEAKLGVDSSAVATTIDYLLKNASSSNPGHKHTLANGATDVTATVTEVNYIDGVTSAIQTQLDGKASSSDLSTHISDTTTHGTTGDIVGTSDTQTLTNKRVDPRTNTTTSSATPSINTDTTDIFTITALAAAITSMTTNLSGTPVNGQKLIIRFKDDGTARAITWGASFASRGATLPTTTVISKTMYVGLIWNSTASVWDCVAVATEA